MRNAIIIGRLLPERIIASFHIPGIKLVAQEIEWEINCKCEYSTVSFTVKCSADQDIYSFLDRFRTIVGSFASWASFVMRGNINYCIDHITDLDLNEFNHFGVTENIFQDIGREFTFDKDKIHRDFPIFILNNYHIQSVQRGYSPDSSAF